MEDAAKTIAGVAAMRDCLLTRVANVSVVCSSVSLVAYLVLSDGIRNFIDKVWQAAFRVAALLS